MEENVEARELTKKPKKKNKRIFVVLTFILIIIIVTGVYYRGEYLVTKELGESYLENFHINITYQFSIIGIIFALWFAIIYISNKFIKKGLKQFFEDEKKAMPKLPNKSIAFILSAIISFFTSGMFIDKTMLFFNTAWFGIQDPIFNKDIGYFLFQKPFIELVLMYIIGLFVALAIYTLAYYIISFNMYFDGIDSKILKKNTLIKQIITYIVITTLCISGLVFIKAEDIVFEKFMRLNDVQNTELYGAGFTDVIIKLWGYRVFSIVILICIISAIRFFRKENSRKTIISLLTIPAYLIVLFIIMTGFEIIFVNPNKLDKEKKYIGYNIESTQKAYNIDIEEVNIENGGTITENDITNNYDVISNIPIVNQDITLKTLSEYQDNVGYYSYNNTKLQLYNIAGKDSLIYVTPREILIDGANRTYNNKTYDYTHGFGSIVTSASTTLENGTVEYLQVDFNGKDEVVEVVEPRIYFGLETNSSIITNAKNKKEFDYPLTTSTNTEYTYTGEAGLQLGFLDRVILAIKTKNISLALNTNATSESKILINRNIIERAKKLMPYFIYDENPYMVITDDGRQVWVLDAYTVSENYPYSQKTLVDNENGKMRINYIRNSVKVLIDSYTGEIKFYLTDRSDPIAMAYRNIYPSLFVDLDTELPEDIARNITYPEKLYSVQSSMYERYHKIQPEVLYRNDDLWDVAKYNTTKTNALVGTRMNPYYTMLKLENMNNEQLGLVIPYTSYGKQNIISYLVGTYDKDNKSKLTLYKFSSGDTVVGPSELDKQIEQDVTISKELASLNVTGTKIIKDMIIVPINNTILYVEPIYQVLLNESTVPMLKKVIVASGNKVAIGNDLQSALSNLVSKYASNIEIESTDSENDLIESIIKANKNLDESINNTDWELIGKDIKRLQELILMLENMKKEEADKNKVTTNSTITNENTNIVDNNTIF